MDVALARGLDYYTGAIFETVVDEPKIGALGGGGRYDKLMSMFSGRDLPTTGMTFGVERMVDVMFELGMIAPMSTPSRALITVFDCLKREHSRFAWARSRVTSAGRYPAKST